MQSGRPTEWDLVQLHKPSCRNRDDTSPPLFLARRILERFVSRFQFYSTNQFHWSPGTHSLVATGSLLTANPDRIVAKKIILSGHPLKIINKQAVVRYMFFNRGTDDCLFEHFIHASYYDTQNLLFLL